MTRTLELGAVAILVCSMMAAFVYGAPAEGARLTLKNETPGGSLIVLNDGYKCIRSVCHRQYTGTVVILASLWNKYDVVRWKGHCKGGALACTLAMDRPRTVGVKWKQSSTNAPIVYDDKGKRMGRALGIDRGNGVGVLTDKNYRVIVGEDGAPLENSPGIGFDGPNCSGQLYVNGPADYTPGSVWKDDPSQAIVWIERGASQLRQVRVYSFPDQDSPGNCFSTRFGLSYFYAYPVTYVDLYGQSTGTLSDIGLRRKAAGVVDVR